MASPVRKDALVGGRAEGFCPFSALLTSSPFPSSVIGSELDYDLASLFSLASPFPPLSFPLNDGSHSRVEIFGIISLIQLAYDLHKEFSSFNYVSIYATIMSINQIIILFSYFSATTSILTFSFPLLLLLFLFSPSVHCHCFRLTVHYDHLTPVSPPPCD